MKIKTTESQIRDEKYGLLGATFAYCPCGDNEDYGSLIMNASVSNGSDSGVGNMMWRSYDEGLSWEEIGFVEKSFQYDRRGSMVKMGGNAALYTDRKAGVILYVSNEMYWIANNYLSTKKFSRPFYRLSFDNGRTWTDKHCIITEGQTKDNPIPDMVFGRNFAICMAPQIIPADDGSLLVGIQCQIVDENGELFEPEKFHFFKSGALRARWNEENLRYDWTMSEYVQVTPEESIRGVFEPTFARLDKNRYMMVMRNSNYRHENEVIGQKFCSVSDDNGCHWSRPEPLTYDDGGTMYASSTVPKLLAHSGGRLFYIGVINDSNPSGNGPRFPLCIAEIDRESHRVKRDTVTVIDTARPEHNAKSPADYTNHGVFEDSKGRIIVYAPFFGGLNRYEIEV